MLGNSSPDVGSKPSCGRMPASFLITRPPFVQMQEMKAEERMVCHFYRESFPCKVMDKHMGTLARKHPETKFVRVHAEKAPFLTGAKIVLTTVVSLPCTCF